jgi:hypothetical protein
VHDADGINHCNAILRIVQQGRPQEVQAPSNIGVVKVEGVAHNCVWWVQKKGRVFFVLFWWGVNGVGEDKKNTTCNSICILFLKYSNFLGGNGGWIG